VIIALESWGIFFQIREKLDLLPPRRRIIKDEKGSAMKHVYLQAFPL
jgi:hypothetical protein